MHPFFRRALVAPDPQVPGHLQAHASIPLTLARKRDGGWEFFGAATLTVRPEAFGLLGRTFAHEGDALAAARERDLAPVYIDD
jgi:hypothetical protein